MTNDFFKPIVDNCFKIVWDKFLINQVLTIDLAIFYIVIFLLFLKKD